MEEVLEMSIKELERYRVLKGVNEGVLSQVKAAGLLGLTDRQVRNLLSQVREKGAKGLVSKKRGRPSNRKTPAPTKNRILSLVREKYPDFGPSFAREKLEEVHDIKVSVETLRKWMTEVHIWAPHSRKVHRHPLRRRRSCLGEMIQADGSHDFWFEDRGEKCALIVFEDDATGKLTSLHFSKGESLDGYFKALEKHLKRYGRPLSIYTDHFRVFDSPVEGNLTQFRRALKTLGIKSILASTPQAKGRVERANRTLQDRLIKEMRLRKISTIDEANKFAPEFVEIFNRKFSKEPASPFNAHRPLGTEVDLERILCRYDERTLTKDGVFQFHNKFYKITEEVRGIDLQGRRVEIRLGKTGAVRAFLKDTDTELRMVQTNALRGLEIPTEITCEDQRKPRVPWAPSAAHPWKMRLYRTRTRQLLQKVV